ncbi:hypothetical protein [Paenibacillus sanguinis]|uniref:hypothetical protein n=1 Tax=Paenibacillus sanguinis TaxID=225906 RepID=UPI000367C5D6|nr:hypothetical protein [Paenibacillus sanguinis]
MDYSWIIQSATMLGIGVIGFFLKSTLAEVKSQNKKTEERVDALEEKLENLKSDLPFIYTTREDFIRTMNNVDNKLEKIHDVLLKGGNQHGTG